MRWFGEILLTATLASHFAASVPLTQPNGWPQRGLRRGVPYLPHDSSALRRGSHWQQKRSLPYSVVQVDGSSPTAQVPGNDNPVPATLTVVHTVTDSTLPSVSTEIVLQQPTDAPEISTLIETVTATPAVPTTSTKYYDDGLWHTSYAVKTFWTTSSAITSTPTAEPAPTSGYSGKATEGPEPRKGRPKHHVVDDLDKWNMTHTEAHAARRFAH